MLLLMIVCLQLHHLMIAEQDFAYIKLLWCSQAIIKTDGRMLGVNASVERVDIGQHLVRPLLWTRCIAV